MYLIGKKVLNFYLEGFRGMTPLGKRLWFIILLKLFIMFGVLKVFFFPKFLDTKFETSAQKSAYIINTLTKNKDHG